MNHRNIVWVIVASLMSLIIIFTIPGWFPSESNLEVLLRCWDDVSGTLSIVQVSEASVEQQFDLKTACKEGTVTFKEYNTERPVRFVFERNNGEIVEVISEYGTDVQAKKSDGYFLVLDITNDPPFIANDHI